MHFILLIVSVRRHKEHFEHSLSLSLSPLFVQQKFVTSPNFIQQEKRQQTVNQIEKKRDIWSQRIEFLTAPFGCIYHAIPTIYKYLHSHLPYQNHKQSSSQNQSKRYPKMKVGVVIAAMAMLVMVLSAAMPGEAAVSCSQVHSYLVPCISYLTNGSDYPTDRCCSGLRNLQAMAKTSADRRATCYCLKQNASQYPNIKDDTASELLAICGIETRFPISRDVDCNEWVLD